MSPLAAHCCARAAGPNGNGTTQRVAAEVTGEEGARLRHGSIHGAEAIVVDPHCCQIGQLTDARGESPGKLVAEKLERL